MEEQKDVLDRTKPLAKQFYKLGEAALKTLQMPMALNSLKRKMQSAAEDALKKIEEADNAIFEQYKLVQKMDVNKLVEADLDKKDAESALESLQVHYKALFGEELPLPKPDDYKD